MEINCELNNCDKNVMIKTQNKYEVIYMGICSNIAIKDGITCWKESIKEAAIPLLENGSINQGYVDAMIENVLVNGPYIVVAPNIALPHARSETGALKSAISILKLNNPVLYPNDTEVRLVICLAAKDSNSHMDALANLADFFLDDDKVQKVLDTSSIDVISEVFDAV